MAKLPLIPNRGDRWDEEGFHDDGHWETFWLTFLGDDGKELSGIVLGIRPVSYQVWRGKDAVFVPVHSTRILKIEKQVKDVATEVLYERSKEPKQEETVDAE